MVEHEELRSAGGRSLSLRRAGQLRSRLGEQQVLVGLVHRQARLNTRLHATHAPYQLHLDNNQSAPLTGNNRYTGVIGRVDGIFLGGRQDA